MRLDPPRSRLRWRTLALVSIGLTAASCGSGDLELTPEELAAEEQHVVVCAGGPTVRGIDVSYWQRQVDWTKVRSAGVEFAISRIGDGTFMDPRFEENWSGMKAAGLVRGAYQFFRAAVDPKVQAELVIASVGQLGPGDLPVTLDIEDASIQGLRPADVEARMKEWLARVEAGTGKRPIIYTGKYVWQASVGATNYSHHPLWLASYGATCPNTPTGWNEWKIWQYSSTGRVNGIYGNVDMNVFNGSRQQLDEFANAASGMVAAGDWVQGFGHPDWAGTGDFDGDGKDDLAWYEHWKDAGVSVQLSTGSGFSSAGQWARALGRPDWAAVGDFDGDGKDDLVWYQAAAQAVRVLRSTGAGFQTASAWATGLSAPDWAAVGDFDGDGKDDLAWYRVADQYSVTVLRSTGTSLVGAGRWLTGFGRPGWAAAGDVDGDGRDDLAWYETWNDQAVTIVRSNGGGFFPGAKWLTGFGPPNWAGLDDVTGDGRADLLWYEGWNQGGLTVAPSTGERFDPGTQWVTGRSVPDWAASADLNGDGRSDMLWYRAVEKNVGVDLTR